MRNLSASRQWARRNMKSASRRKTLFWTIHGDPSKQNSSPNAVTNPSRFATSNSQGDASTLWPSTSGEHQKETLPWVACHRSPCSNLRTSVHTESGPMLQRGRAPTGIHPLSAETWLGMEFRQVVENRANSAAQSPESNWNFPSSPLRSWCFSSSALVLG